MAVINQSYKGLRTGAANTALARFVPLTSVLLHCITNSPTSGGQPERESKRGQISIPESEPSNSVRVAAKRFQHMSEL